MSYQLTLGVASAIVNLPSNNSSIWIVLKIVENFRRKRYDASHQLSLVSWSRLGVLAHRRDTKYNRNSRGSSFYGVAEVLVMHGSLRVFIRVQNFLHRGLAGFLRVFSHTKSHTPGAANTPPPRDKSRRRKARRRGENTPLPENVSQ